AQAAARDAAERAERAREAHSSVDAVYRVVGRDADVGGGIMAGALSYRLFVWLLPFALVAIAGLGFASAAENVDPKDAAGSLGLAGLVSQSVSSAARGSSRWYALLIGVPILLYATRTLLKTLIVIHRLIWGDMRANAPRPTTSATLQLLA